MEPVLEPVEKLAEEMEQKGKDPSSFPKMFIGETILSETYVSKQIL